MTPQDEDLVLVGRIARPHGLRGQVVVDPETDFLEARFAPGATLLRQRETSGAGTPPGTPSGARPGSRPGSQSGERPGARQTTLETLRITSVRFHRGRPIVSFEGIDTIEQAEALGRPDLWIRAASRAALPAGQFYHDALIGCRVETTTGEIVGTVTRIEGAPGVPLLVVVADADASPVESAALGAPASSAGKSGTSAPARRQASEVLIPLAETICRVIDPAARKIVIDPPDGLLDVNG